jgi:hypothetical protein
MEWLNDYLSPSHSACAGSHAHRSLWMMAAGSRLSTPLDPPPSSHNNIDFAMQMDTLYASIVHSWLFFGPRDYARAFVLPDEPFSCEECTLGILPYVFLPSFQMLIPSGYAGLCSKSWLCHAKRDVSDYYVYANLFSRLNGFIIPCINYVN